MEYRVGTFREAGLDAKWTKRNYKPCIAVKKPDQGKWVICNTVMFEQMKQHGIIQGYENSTVLIDTFSI